MVTSPASKCLSFRHSGMESSSHSALCSLSVVVERGCDEETCSSVGPSPTDLLGISGITLLPAAETLFLEDPGNA